eukprot:m.140279 g.140279  ORF g.140279 m.140279 type:complete len:270 (+) comp14031_c1_seq1:299-1108(+)
MHHVESVNLATQTFAMCMKADQGLSIGSMKAGGVGGVTPRLIDVDGLKKKMDKVIIIDVREADEMGKPDVKQIEGAIQYPLGPLLRDAADDSLDEKFKTTPLVTICNAGYRSGIASDQLNAMGYDCCSLHGGATAFFAPKAAWYSPEYVVLLTTTDTQKATLACSVATASQAQSRKTILVLMGDAPLLFRKPEIENPAPKFDEINIGEPFKPLKGVVAKFLDLGGQVFACKSCVKHSGLEYSKMRDYVNPMQAPDLSRMTVGAQGSSSF